MERAVPDRHFCVAFAATKGRASADLADVTRNFSASEDSLADRGEFELSGDFISGQ